MLIWYTWIDALLHLVIFAMPAWAFAVTWERFDNWYTEKTGKFIHVPEVIEFLLEMGYLFGWGYASFLISRSITLAMMG